MPVLNSQAVGDKYPLSSGAKGAIIANVWNSRGGWFSVTGATAYVRLQYGKQGSEHWVEEIFLGAGAFVVVPPNCRGLQFRNGVAGVTATVTAQIAQGDEPPLAISTIGQTNTVLVSSLNFQHNDLAVATEPTLDFEDTAGVLNFVLVDDPANTRLKLSVSFPNPVLIPGTLQIGNVDTFVSRSSANTLDLGSAGTRGALRLFASATGDVELSVRVTADANPRFTLGGDGLMTWGPGNAVTDTTMQRVAAGVLQIGITGQGGRWAAQQTAAGNLIYSGAVDGDTVARYQVQADGTIKWGPGNAAADIGLNRPASAQLGLTVQPANLRSLHANPGAFGGDGVNASWALVDQGAASHCFFQSTAPSGFNSLVTTVPGDATDWRFVLDTTGTMTWGPGNAARDVTLQRQVQTVASLVVAKGGFGYAEGVGQGGVVTQITSLTTGVTINTICGQINTFTSALAANLNTVFTVTNNKVEANDQVIVSWSNNPWSGNIPIWVTGIFAGSFQIAYTNLGALTSSQTGRINFTIIKQANN